MALRIERIDFSPWGCFEEHSLPLSTRSGDVDLIHGRNASGKSTASRGERSLLYGIDERTVDSHTYDYADLRIGARLQLDGKSVELSRRKRRVGSLAGPNGESLPDDLLLGALGGLTREVYEALFVVDNETLVQGGTELLQGRGEIGASLFAAAAGIAFLHQTLSDFEGEAEGLFNPRGRTDVLHKRLSDLREAEKRLRERTLRPARHREMTRELEQDEQASEAATVTLRELDRKTREIERSRLIAPLVASREELLAELREIGEVPDLPEDAAARRVEAEGRITAGRRSLARATAALRKLEAEIETIVVGTLLLARSDEVRAVKENVAAISKAAGDRRKREGELQEAKAALDIAASSAGCAPEEMGALRRPQSARRALDACLSQHDDLTSALRGARSRRDQAERDRSDARSEFAATSPALDIASLEVALTAALRLGPISDQTAECELEFGLREREANERMARLTPAPSSVGDLRSLSTPSREQAKRVAGQAEAYRRALESLEDESRRLDVEELELEEQRRRLEVEGEAPSAETLGSARELRDRRWREIRRAGMSGDSLAETDYDAFEHFVVDADRLADCRTEHATQIERTAAVHGRAARLAQERSGLEQRRRDIEEQQATEAAEWGRAWETTGLGLVGCEDAVAWLDERDEILRLDRVASEARERADTLRERMQRHASALALELGAIGREVAEDLSLDLLVARAQSEVATARELAAARASLEANLVAAERNLAGAERDLTMATQAWAEWEAAWPQRRAEAGLPETAVPSSAHEIARWIDEGLAQQAKIGDLERRIAGIDSDRAEFDVAVEELCADLAPELAPLEPLRAGAELHVRLTEQERAHERRELLITQLANKAEEVAALEGEIAEAEDVVQELIVLAGAEARAELPQIEARVARANALRKEIAEAETQIAEVGDGRFVELAAALQGFDRDAAAVELEGLHNQAEALRAERDAIKERIGHRRRELSDAETDVSAVQAAQDVALARAAVREAAVAHAKAKLSAAVVRRAMERYRAHHQDPLLRRANELFKRFTCGSFVELFVDTDDHGAGLLVGRQRDRVLKRVPEMSKGTREQLFLALRIAAIERYVASSGAVPVLFDDVFIESDPPRSERIFEALGELAAQTQVIVLTHHEHLIEVGRRALNERLIAQDLPDSAPTLREAAAA